MTEVFGLPLPVLAGQIMLGLVNGCFYAVLSLGLAVIFGLLRIVNFAHGAFFMAGAFGAWMLQRYAGLGYWAALLLVPETVPFCPQAGAATEARTASPSAAHHGAASRRNEERILREVSPSLG